MPIWEVLNDQDVWSNSFLRLHLETIRNRDGAEADWTVIDVPDAVCTIPVDDDGALFMIHQYRHTVGENQWEFPAGRIDPGESREDAARRELAEGGGDRGAHPRAARIRLPPVRDLPAPDSLLRRPRPDEGTGRGPRLSRNWSFTASRGPRSTA